MPPYPLRHFRYVNLFPMVKANVLGRKLEMYSTLMKLIHQATKLETTTKLFLANVFGIRLLNWKQLLHAIKQFKLL